MRNNPVFKFESPNHKYRRKPYSIAATYFFHEGPQFPVVPWHLPFPVVLFVGARRVRAWRVLKRRPRAKVKMHRHANPSRKFISWTLSGCITWVEYERHGWFTEMNPVWWKTLGCARRLLDRRWVGACQVSGARNLAFIVPTCSISPVLTGNPWNLEAICRARDSAITIYRRVSPIVNSLLLDGSKAVQKESSPDPTSFFHVLARVKPVTDFIHGIPWFITDTLTGEATDLTVKIRFFAYLDTISTLRDFAIFFQIFSRSLCPRVNWTVLNYSNGPISIAVF